MQMSAMKVHFQIAECSPLYQKKEGELQKDSVWAKFAYTASDGKTYQVDYYNLDVIISVGNGVTSLMIVGSL